MNVTLAAAGSASSPALSDAAMRRVFDSPVEDRLATALTTIAEAAPTRTAVARNAGTDKPTAIDYGTLAARLVDLEQQLDEARPIGVVARTDQVESLIVLTAACSRQHVPLAILADDAADSGHELDDWLSVDDTLSIPFTAAGSMPRGEFATVAPTIWVATSGTSGPPKIVDHSWESLLAAARLSSQWHSLTWLLVYDAKRWAGIQVWVQAMLTGGCVVVPASRDPDVVARAVVDRQVTVLPATPTLMRRLLTSADPAVLATCQLERITLGGEAVDGPLLDQIKETFPNAGVSHVYATTELGEVFRVRDGLPGFPAHWLTKPLPGGARLFTRRDGELLVQLSRDTAEVATGDLVEQRGDRFEFVGRRSDVIVVGGAKVYPKRVEEVVRGVPGIAEARVHSVASPITGELVAVDVVVSPGFSPDDVRSGMLTHCRHELESHAVPRIVTFVEQIATTPAGKVPRR
jgi:acyl-CoA synthetase (AMP-forming)/AMP-acid ligase II